MSHSIPIPVPNFDNAGFWDGCRQRELRVQRCTSCGGVRHPPRPMCPQCNSVEFEWMKTSGRGTIYSFTIVHGPTLPAFQERAPHNVVVVELDEGPYIVSNVVECAPSALRIGTRVEVTFSDVSESLTLPLFRLVPD